MTVGETRQVFRQAHLSGNLGIKKNKFKNLIY